LQKTEKAVEIGKYIEPFDERNTVGLTKNDVRGISTSKEIIPTKAKLEGVKLDNYKLFYPNQIAFVPDTSRRGEKISLALNNSENTYIVSSITTIFSTDTNKLLSSYLMLFFQRPEFDRYARFNSWGSAREVFSWEDMKDVKIPIPNLEIQNSIIKI